MEHNIKTFVVHLARATGRRPLVDKLLEASPFPAEIFSAIEGAKLTGEEQAQAYLGAPRYAPHYPFALGHGEIGCFLSHRAIWQKIVDDGLDGALILEDDLEVLGGFDEVAQFAADHLANHGYIQFQVRAVSSEAKIIASQGQLRLVQPQVTPLRTSAQLVSAKVAQRLLDLTAPFDRPVDTFLQMHWVTGVHLVCVVPSCVSDRTEQGGGSTISRKTPFRDKLSREVKRFAYRAAVRRYSKRG
jgi:GR25 family glycosyltransferase involved in LPS biosynthesis